ncbi:MAG: ABC transporter substrate-binding protein [Spirochaetales bacterium]|nr:ABC transporter substrate-binding protein [Spirochaetales bacterium]
MKIYPAVFLVLLLLSCHDRSDIEIGFVADFSSGKTVLGQLCRNAAQLAIDDINSSGGINGRNIVLLTRDNRDVESVQDEIVNELDERGVKYIIGPFLSRMAPSIIDAASGRDLLIFSPVVSSDLFAGIDDNFFRIHPDASIDGIHIGEALVERGDRSVVLIRDSSNDIYTDSFMKGVREVMQARGIEVLWDSAFLPDDDLKEIASAVMDLKPDGIVFSALGKDAGAIIQQYGKSAQLPHLYGDEWSRTTGVHLHAGKFSENMINPGIINSHADKTLEEEFKRRYEETFLEEPVFFVYYTYEILMIIARTIEEIGTDATLEEIKNYIIGMNDFDGILGHLEFNAFGDALREKQLYIIHNQKYEPY